MILVTGATGIALRALPADKSSAPVTTFVYDNGTDIIDASKDVALSFTNGQYLADSNGNELLTFGVVASAVNEVKITNAATGTAGPIIAPTGESNVNLQLRPAGTGVITVGTSAANATVTSKGAHDLILSTNEGSSSGTITITDAADGDITLTPNGSGVVKATDYADATAAVNLAKDWENVEDEINLKTNKVIVDQIILDDNNEGVTSDIMETLIEKKPSKEELKQAISMALEASNKGDIK